MIKPAALPLLAFDFPNPSEPNGRRNVSNVPTQALALLNNELVHDQARRWAERELAISGGPAERVARRADLAHVLFKTRSFIFIR